MSTKANKECHHRLVVAGTRPHYTAIMSNTQAQPPARTLRLNENLIFLRRSRGWSLEAVAERVGVSRQAVSRWEAGSATPDIFHCDALAKLYDVSIDNLLHFDRAQSEVPIPPAGKHALGVVRLDDEGRVEIPHRAREILQWTSRTELVVLVDENPQTAGVALAPADQFFAVARRLMDQFYPQEGADAQSGLMQPHRRRDES